MSKFTAAVIETEALIVNDIITLVDNTIAGAATITEAATETNTLVADIIAGAVTETDTLVDNTIAGAVTITEADTETDTLVADNTTALTDAASYVIEIAEIPVIAVDLV